MPLYAAMMGSVLEPIGLFRFAWSSKPDANWISPLLGAYLIDTYECTLSASAVAANGIMRYIVDAVLPLFMYEHLHVDWVTSFWVS
jgi:hypothetical protein